MTRRGVAHHSSTKHGRWQNDGGVCYALLVRSAQGRTLLITGALFFLGCTALFGTERFIRADGDLEVDAANIDRFDSALDARPPPGYVDAGRIVDAAVTLDLDASPDSSADASRPDGGTLTVGNDCNAEKCRGGADGLKDMRGATTAAKVCLDRGYASASSYTIGAIVAGRYCWYESGSYACDPSCSTCNRMLTVTCK
jgi:hypothetical protein